MDYKLARAERRQLKQQLFKIRLHIEDGNPPMLSNRQEELKKQYEALPGFTSWHDFPDKWDIGDPHNVKANAYASNDVDAANFKKLAGKSYETIVPLDQAPEPELKISKQEFDDILRDSGVFIENTKD